MKNSAHKPLIIGILLAIGIAVIVVVYLLTRDSTPEEEKWVDAGWSFEAKNNDYLAAKIFLEKLGTTTEITFNHTILDELPRPESLIILADNAILLTPKQTTELIEWVASGGQILIEVDTNNASYEDFFSYFDIELLEEKKCNHPKSAEKTDGESNDIAEYTDSTLYSGSVSETIRLESYIPRDNFVLADDTNPALILEHPCGDILTKARLGSGSVTFVSPGMTSLWINHYINQYDHAYLLGKITGSAKKIWIIHPESSKNSPSFFYWLWTHYLHAIIGLLLIIAVWIWRNSFRITPITLINDTKRRKLLEHIHANNQFLWRNRQEQLFIDNLRAMFNKELTLKYPHFKSLSTDDQKIFLCELGKLDAEKISLAIYTKTIETETNWLKTISILQHLRKQL